MRYVVVLPEQAWPATSGGRIANRHLCEGLVALGHEVTVVAVDPTRGLASPGPVVRFDSRPATWPAWACWRARLGWERRRNPFAREAWALGVPVVPTVVGIEGLGATHTVDALVADDPDGLGIDRLPREAMGGRRAPITRTAVPILTGS